MRTTLVNRETGERRFSIGVAFVIGVILASALVALPIASMAQTTPPPIVPTPQPDTASVEPEPAGLPAPASDIDLTAPHLQTIAQGVVDLEGSVVWRVREVAPSAEAAAAETAGFSFNLARTGTTLLFNEASGGRSRLEPGEAGFVAANDPTARTASGPDPATVWVFEVVAPNAQAGDALTAGTVLFTSDIVDDYPEGTFDAEFKRAVLLPNESLELATTTGPSLVMVTAGRLQGSSNGSAPVPLDAGVGRLSREALSLRNTGSDIAIVVIGAIGDPVDDASATSAETSRAEDAEQTATNAETPTATDEGAADTAPEEAAPVADEQSTTEESVPAAESAEEPAADQVVAPSGSDTDGDGLSDEEEAAYGSDPLNQDYDADGLLDGVEVYQYGTDPLNNDSDGDGILDGAEVNEAGTNPASTDSDGDGLSDTDETYTYGTGPAAFDTDGDGVGDGEEVLVFGTDPTDPASGP